MHGNLKAKLHDITEGNPIILRQSLMLMCAALPQLTAEVFINSMNGDRKVWKLTSNVPLSVKPAYTHVVEFLRIIMGST